MATIEIDTTVGKPITSVYKAVTGYDDVEEMKQWRTNLQSVGITAGNPLRTGSMIAMTKQFMGSSTFINADVLELERNKKIQLKGRFGRFAFTRIIEFNPVGRDTVVRDKFTFDAGWIWFWYTPFFNNALRAQLKNEWTNLKQMLEAQPN